MKSESMLNEQTIDELVSGQLSGERYRAVLKALDADPKRWRECALAFLEDQALRAELKELAKGTIDWHRDEACATDDQTLTTANASDRSSQAIGTAVAYPAMDSAKFTSRWGSHALSTAALLMVSFTVGWLGSELLAERQQAVAPSQNSVATTPDQAAPARPNPALRSPEEFINPEQFVSHQPTQFLPLDHEIPRSFRELERQGKVYLESQDGLVRQRLPDGSTVIFPVQEVRVIPATLSF